MSKGTQFSAYTTPSATGKVFVMWILGLRIEVAIGPVLTPAWLYWLRSRYLVRHTRQLVAAKQAGNNGS